MSVTKNTVAQEYLPKETYSTYGDVGMRFVDKKIPIIAQYLRDYYKSPIRMNNWYIAKDGERVFDARVLRLSSDEDYRRYSDHSYGRAIDFTIDGISATQVQQDIKDNKDCLADKLVELGVTGIEVGTSTWTHLSVSDLSLWNINIIHNIKLLNAPK